jgi:hypothetical protein
MMRIKVLIYVELFDIEERITQILCKYFLNFWIIPG